MNYKIEYHKGKGWCVIDVKYGTICNNWHYKTREEAEKYMGLLEAFHRA